MSNRVPEYQIRNLGADGFGRLIQVINGEYYDGFGNKLVFDSSGGVIDGDHVNVTNPVTSTTQTLNQVLLDFEVKSNKQNNLNPDGSGHKYPSVDAVNFAITELRGLINTTLDKNYIFIQASPSNQWVINHNLNKITSVVILDSNGTVVIGQVTYDASEPTKKITINFNSVVSGKAILN